MLSTYVIISTLLMSIESGGVAGKLQLNLENEYTRLYTSYEAASSQADKTKSLELAKQTLVFAEKIYSSPSAELAVLYHYP